MLQPFQDAAAADCVDAAGLARDDPEVLGDEPEGCVRVISVLAGAGFVLHARASDASVTGLAGYALLGGVFFLVSALRMRRTVAA